MSEINRQSFEQSIPSVDAALHVKGESVFTNDIPHPKDCLFAAVGWSKKSPLDDKIHRSSKSNQRS